MTQSPQWIFEADGSPFGFFVDEWLYAREGVMFWLLLLLYPSSFRTEYGGEMSRDFARNRQQASGFVAVVLVWLAAIADAIMFLLSPASRGIYGQDLIVDNGYTLQ